jgi:DNA-binding HxlR family transcriptional regulator
MPDQKPLTVKEKVLAILTKEGQGYRDLRAKLDCNPTTSALNLALRKLESQGLAVREKVTKRGPKNRVGTSVDLVHEPRVLWRLK